MIVDRDRYDTNMGRLVANFLDPTIGNGADACPRWIDRHFGTAYATKSLYKVASPRGGQVLMNWMVRHRQISLKLLKAMVYVLDLAQDEAEPAFWLHLQSAWYAAYSHCLLAPMLAEGRVVLVDGWYYKFATKLRLLGFYPETLDTAFAAARKPDAVILLDIDPAHAWTRQRTFNQSELGLHQGYAALGRESFLSYQGEVLAGLRGLAARPGWTVLRLDAEAAPAPNAEHLVSGLRGVMKATASARQ